MDLVADIKQRLSIEELVGQYVELKRSGRNYKALCPFHSEKTPSFYISVEKQIAFCFGCQRGGDIFQFLQEVDGIGFQDALKQLAEKTGLDMSQYQHVSHTPAVSKDEKKQYNDVHDLAVRYFRSMLWDTEDGRKVLDYVRGRGLTDATIRDWNIGFSLEEYDGFLKHASQEKIDRTTLIKSGLVISKDTDAQHIYDRFRMRLMFPIQDFQGRTVGFGGRALKKGMEPKYLNSPETASYKKSEILFALPQAKQAIRSRGHVIMVEGYFDAIACHQADIKEVVATSGTALTPDHAKILKRMTDSFYLCFDNDNAGWEATKRAFLVLQAVEGSVRVIRVPYGKDPAECISHSKELFLQAVEEAKPFFEVYLEKEIIKEALTPERIAHILSESLGFIRVIPNKVLQDITIRALASKLGVKEVVIYDELKRSATTQSFKSLSPKSPAPSTDSALQLRPCKPHELLIVYMLNMVDKAGDFIQKVDENDFLDETLVIFKRIKDVVELGRPVSLDLVSQGLDDSFRAKVEYYALYGEAIYASLSVEVFEKDVLTALDKVVQNRKNVQLEALKRVIQNFQSEGKKSEMLIALDQLREKLK